MSMSAVTLVVGGFVFSLGLGALMSRSGILFVLASVPLSFAGVELILFSLCLSKVSRHTDPSRFFSESEMNLVCLVVFSLFVIAIGAAVAFRRYLSVGSAELETCISLGNRRDPITEKES